VLMVEDHMPVRSYIGPPAARPVTWYVGYLLRFCCVVCGQDKVESVLQQCLYDVLRMSSARRSVRPHAPSKRLTSVLEHGRGGAGNRKSRRSSKKAKKLGRLSQLRTGYGANAGDQAEDVQLLQAAQTPTVGELFA